MHIEAGSTTIERRLIQDAAQKRIPINGSIELLPLCNMRCDMCYVRMDRQEMESKGRLRTAEEWLEVARQMRDAGTLFLLLTGGEPLLYPGFRDLFAELKRMGMILTVNTNGTLIDEDWADFFAKNKPRRINITVYGSNNETYETLCHFPRGYDRVMNGIRLLQERGVDVKMAASVTPANREDVPGLIELARSMNTFVSVDCYMMPTRRENDEAYDGRSRLSPRDMAYMTHTTLLQKIGEERYRDYVRRQLDLIDHRPLPETPVKEPGGCLAGQCSFTVNWQGEMRPCVILSQPSVSVFDRPFGEAWQRITESHEGMCICADCSVCKYRPVCHICPAAGLLEAGAYDAKPEYLCDYAEELVRLMWEYMGG